MSPPNRPSALRRPLSAAVLHILLALTDGPRHGYAIKQEAELGSNGLVRLKPGTLYEAIQRLLDAGLVRETSGESDPANGQEAQRRYYELTARGRRVLTQEIEQLGRLVDYANGKLELA
jgi:DNA-binding PadR family transcriptional regulator